MRNAWLLGALFLSLLLAFLHGWAMEDFLYWRYLWLDIPMHYLGGLTSAVFLVVVLQKHRPRLFVLGMIGIAVGWEIFEYVFQFVQEADYTLDTIIDIIMDTLGALTAYVAARLTIWRRVP